MNEGPAYLSDNTSLRIDIWNYAGTGTNVLLNIEAKLWRFGEEKPLSPLQFAITPNNILTQITKYISLSAGYLMSARVSVGSGTVLRGQCWVTLTLAEGDGTSGITLQTLAADYVTNGSPISFPGGFIRQSTEGTGYIQNLNLGNTVVGSHWTYTVPANTRISVLGVAFVLRTNAVAGNRRTRLYYQPNGLTASRFDPGENTQGPSLVYSWYFSPRDYSHVLDATTQDRYESLPALDMQTGDIIGDDTVDFSVGDQLQGIIMGIERWILV